MFLTLLKGFGTSGSLIVAIGAQNAFLIRQGMLRRHLFMTAFLCSVIDALLILLGVLGFGQLITAYPLLIELSKYFAIIFLFFYIFFILSDCFQKPSRNENWLSKLTATIFHLRCYKQSVSRVLFRLRGDNHLSRHGSCLPAQATQPGRIRGPHHPFPIRSCSVWGLPKPASHLAAGALLPHLSTLTWTNQAV